MKIGIIGTGYVGLVHGVVMADFGLEVICADINQKKIKMLQTGEVPIYEPGLKELLDKVNNRIEFTSDLMYAVKNSEIVFIAVGTPESDNGSADMKYVYEVAKTIGQYIDDYKVIVNKSTVPVGTGQKVKAIITEELIKRDISINFDIVSNPEFLREGKAIRDSQLPDRIVIGYESDQSKEIMKKIYDVLYLKETPFIFTNIETAELIKYASNAFLAVKISFINEMALLAEKVGGNVQEIAKAMGMDGRISPKFLNAGPGYGGSCFPKDTKAIVETAQLHSEEMLVIKAAIDANEKQKRKMVNKIINEMDGIEGKTIGVLGLSFKPETDDMREAPSIDIITGLIKEGARIKAYCPEGIIEAKKYLADLEKSITYCNDEYDAVKEVEGIAIITEWHQFRGMDIEKVRSLVKDNYLFDLRNIYVKDNNIRSKFKYYPVGMK